MPSLTATAQPVFGRVLIQVNWSDVPAVTFVTVYRVLSDGSRTPVRVHTSTDAGGTAIELSGGQAVLYDTEAPLDVPLYYVAESTTAPNTPMLGLQLSDTFTRVTANGWGTADTGQTYLLVGPAANYATTGTQGTISLNVINTYRVANPVPIKAYDASFSIDVTVPLVATGAPIVTEVWLRATDNSNAIKYRMSWGLLGVVTVSIASVVGGSTITAPGAVSPDIHIAGAQWRVRGEAFGTQLRMKAWPVAGPEPAGWLVTTNSAAVPSVGDIDVAVFLSTGNTNPQPLVISFDNFIANTDQVGEVETVLASGDDLWLKAPLRPWADQRVVLSVPQEPDCVPESAIFFQAMDIESRQARTPAFIVNNRKNPIAATRTRGGIQSLLGLITRRFADRDAVIILNADGDPLLFQGPADYGIPDRYMSVGDYTVSRLTSDHRQQWRAHGLPHVEVDRPAGLADGVLGVRWVDLCDLYGTFAAAQAAGLTWTLVLLGYGSLSPSPVTGFRLYSDIPLDFATYAAIPLGGRTYEDLLEDR